MSWYVKGALVEYGANLVGPIPNVVIFQFNPETITRNLEVPPRPSGASMRENNQAGDVPMEKIGLVAQFTTHEDAARRDPTSIALGIGPQLAALEKMVHPAGVLTDLLNKAIDKIGDMVSGSGGGKQATQPIPREKYPRLLFIWGPGRALPVIVTAMSIVEKQYDRFLNPTLADVTIGLTVIKPDPCSDDAIARGASKYTSVVRDALALVNLESNAMQIAEQISDLIHFT